MISFKGKHFEKFMWVKAVFCSFEMLAIPLWSWKITNIYIPLMRKGKASSRLWVREYIFVKKNRKQSSEEENKELLLHRKGASPVALVVKEPACQCRSHKRCGFDSWGGKIPWRRAWQSTPVFLPGESYGQRSLAGYSPRSHKVLDTTEAT